LIAQSTLGLMMQKPNDVTTFCGTDEACCGDANAATVKHLSWTKTLLLMTVGGLACLLIVKLFGA
jgi:hypothetical protein